MQFASQYLVPEQLYSALSLLNSFTICGVSFWLLLSRLQNHYEHNHRHYYHFSKEAINPRSLIAISVGEISPCPSALILLLNAIALHQVVSRMRMIGIFSLGSLSVLIGLGLLAIYNYKWLERFPSVDKLKNKLRIAIAILNYSNWYFTDCICRNLRLNS